MPQYSLSDAYRIASSIVWWSDDKNRATPFACKFAAEKTGADVNDILNLINDSSPRRPFYQ